MKRRFVLSAAAVAALMLTGCATEVKTLPRMAAGSQRSPHAVPVYFGEQHHPAVMRKLGSVSYSARIARQTSDRDTACHEALAEAVEKLRAAAHDRNANAVIDVSTRFHGTENRSSTDFTCGVSASAAAVAVSGQAVVLEAK
jgi:uncharacterized protein YbjQ (UPF0145 family)